MFGWEPEEPEFEPEMACEPDPVLKKEPELPCEPDLELEPKPKL